jgi:LPXTG-motif cell wall-anchored protein
LLLVALVAAVSGAVPGSRAEAAPKNPPGDPPGNNGTVKINASDPTEDPNDNPKGQGNQPHIDGCILWLNYTGFDQGQTADITFTAQAPSGKGEVLLAEKGVAISTTPAGGGQDQDAVIPYNLTSAVQGLKANKNQGYHIKLSSNTIQAPGGAKHKVFWVNCTPAPPTALRVVKGTKGAVPEGTGPFNFTVNCNHHPLNIPPFDLAPGGKKDITGVPPGTTCVVTEAPVAGATTTVTESPGNDDNATDGEVTLAAGTPAIVTFLNTFPGEGGTPPPTDNSDLPAVVAGANEEAGAAVLGESLTAPDGTEGGTTLPRTGGDPGALLAAGLWALSAGSLALAAGRRRRRP